jgi:hypothetical protein
LANEFNFYDNIMFEHLIYYLGIFPNKYFINDAILSYLSCSNESTQTLLIYEKVFLYYSKLDSTHQDNTILKLQCLAILQNISKKTNQIESYISFKTLFYKKLNSCKSIFPILRAYHYSELFEIEDRKSILKICLIKKEKYNLPFFPRSN